jgi:hypothetical protein
MESEDQDDNVMGYIGWPSRILMENKARCTSRRPQGMVTFSPIDLDQASAIEA